MKGAAGSGVDESCAVPNAVSEEQYAKVLARLQAFCVKKECCASEIMTKAVKMLDGDRRMTERLLDSLREDKFVDDGRYAAAFAREKSALTGWGARKIEYQLMAKGIGRPEIETALAEIDGESAGAKLNKLLAAKYRSLREDPACKLKLLKFAMGRGYSYDDVKDIVDGLISEDKEQKDGSGRQRV